jgi:hypothetical protein
MNPFSKAGSPRFIFTTGVALLLQAAAGYSQYAQEALPSQEFDSGEQVRMIEPMQVQPMVEPTVGGDPFVMDAPARDTVVVDSTGSKEQIRQGNARKWRLLLGVSAAAIYDDNIFLSERNEKSDFIFTLSPSIGIGIGDPERRYLSLIYTPSFVYFADHSDESAVEHQVNLIFRHRTDRWVVEANARFAALTGANGEDENERGERVGERVNRETYVAGLRLTYLLSDKTSIENATSVGYTDYDEFLDTFDIVNRTFIDYMVTGKTTLGLGVGVGYAKTDGGPEQVYEQGLLRIGYTPTSKITLTANGGAEFRQVDGGENQVNGIFGLGVAYKPFDGTSLSLEGYRRVRPSSVFADTNYTVTGVAAIARQRILHKFHFSLAAGYEHTEYNSLVDRTNFTRDDNFFFIRPAVEFRIRERALVELFYEYRRNDSSFQEFEFANNRIGVRVGFTF